MNRSLWYMLLPLAVWMAVSSASAGAVVRYPVSKILKVRSLSEFDCRIGAYAAAPSVRFHVQIRNVDPAAEIPEDQAAEYVRERLSQAERVVLENIRFRNYFRLVADVKVDGTDLRDELVRLGLSAADEPPTGSGGQPDVPAPPQPKRRYHPPSVEPTPTRTPANTSKKVVAITLQDLLETQADLSSLDETTPLGEALHVISEAVRPRVPFVILWSDLQTNALVDQQTPIGVGGFDKRVKLSYALKIILHSVSRNAPSKLTLAYEGHVVTLGTRRGLLQKARVKSYSIEDIVLAPSYDTADNRGTR